MMGRGVLGTVTEVAADHYTVKTAAGDLYPLTDPTVNPAMNRSRNELYRIAIGIEAIRQAAMSEPQK